MNAPRRPLVVGLTLCLLAGFSLQSAPLAALSTGAAASPTEYQVAPQSQIVLRAGILRRTLSLREGVPFTESLVVGHDQMLDAPSGELSFRIRKASPNRRPVGLKPGEGGAIDVVGKQLTTDVLDVHDLGNDGGDGVKWTDPVKLDAESWGRILGRAKLAKVHHANGEEIVLTTSAASQGAESPGLSVTIHYMVFNDQPAIRKWVEIRNEGASWMNIDNLRLEDWKLAAKLDAGLDLTPTQGGAVSSLVARGLKDGTSGIILGNEIPSALRLMAADGSMGYADERFEWVIGPGEAFVSEPVFIYGYAGAVEKTISAESTPLDRAVEGPFQHFLRKDIGLISDPARVQAPQYSNWTTFGPRIDDALIRQLADIASAVGFQLFELEEGWAKGELGTEPDLTKFPKLLETTAYIRSKGMKLGLWVSSYRSPWAKDFIALPDAASRPLIKRMGGLGMSFDSSWKSYYAADLADLSRQTGATYFKQDFTDIRFGDIAEGHESRTRKESLLRGLRGLLFAQDELRRLAPSVSPEITHEIYWGTPGTPCDVAALQHVQSCHVPPNDYSGSLQGRSKAERNSTSYADLGPSLLKGAFNARTRFYAHRGLPLYAIEYYGAATFNAEGSLTPALQDRQVASWLMGAPAVFSGDLRTLTPENIARYRSRFDMLARMEKAYGIYGHFQFSGVPQPTDTGWHWWGKLNDKGYGAVVVLRGSGGAASQAVNIPWVQAHTRYRVRGLFAGKDLGTFTGSQLQHSGIPLSLGVYDQEILELAPL